MNDLRELTIDELDTVSGGGMMSDAIDMMNMRTQMYMDRRSKAFEALSNIIKKISDTSGQIVANMK